MTDKDKNLGLKAGLGVLTTPILFGLPIFAAAGTFNYWEAWLFLAVFGLATAFHTIELYINDRDMLKRRMRAGPTFEGRPAQRIIMIIIIVAFSLLPIISGIDHRFHWSHVPDWLVFVGDFLIAFSYFVFYVVFKQNRFASATIQIHEGQTVSTDGLYGIVRHPMYAGSFFLMLGMALSLGSYWALCVLPLTFPVLHWRMVDEEKCLVDELQGYQDYCTKVRFRLIPGIY